MLHTSLALRLVSPNDTCANEGSTARIAGTIIIAAETYNFLLEVGDGWYEMSHVVAYERSFWGG